MENQNYEVQDGGIEINIGELIQKLMNWLWVIILATAVSGIIVMLVSMFYVTPKYESSTAVYVMNNSRDSGGSSLDYSDMQIASFIVKDYEQLIKSREVLETTISDLNLDMETEDLSRDVTVTASNDSRILTITVTNTDPNEAQVIADKIREISAEQIVDIMGIEAVNTVDPADFPTEPSSPNIKKNTVLGALLGFVLTCAIIIIISLFNDHINTAEDVEKYLNLSVLGTIPLNYEALAEKKKKSAANKKKKR